MCIVLPNLVNYCPIVMCTMATSSPSPQHQQQQVKISSLTKDIYTNVLKNKFNFLRKGHGHTKFFSVNCIDDYIKEKGVNDISPFLYGNGYNVSSSTITNTSLKEFKPYYPYLVRREEKERQYLSYNENVTNLNSINSHNHNETNLEIKMNQNKKEEYNQKQQQQQHQTLTIQKKMETLSLQLSLSDSKSSSISNDGDDSGDMNLDDLNTSIITRTPKNHTKGQQNIKISYKKKGDVSLNSDDDDLQFDASEEEEMRKFKEEEEGGNNSFLTDDATSSDYSTNEKDLEEHCSLLPKNKNLLITPEKDSFLHKNTKKKILYDREAYNEKVEIDSEYESTSDDGEFKPDNKIIEKSEEEECEDGEVSYRSSRDRSSSSSSISDSIDVEDCDTKDKRKGGDIKDKRRIIDDSDDDDDDEDGLSPNTKEHYYMEDRALALMKQYNAKCDMKKGIIYDTEYSINKSVPNHEINTLKEQEQQQQQLESNEIVVDALKMDEEKEPIEGFNKLAQDIYNIIDIDKYYIPMIALKNPELLDEVKENREMLIDHAKKIAIYKAIEILSQQSTKIKKITSQYHIINILAPELEYNDTDKNNYNNNGWGASVKEREIYFKKNRDALVTQLNTSAISKKENLSSKINFIGKIYRDLEPTDPTKGYGFYVLPLMKFIYKNRKTNEFARLLDLFKNIYCSGTINKCKISNLPGSKKQIFKSIISGKCINEEYEPFYVYSIVLHNKERTKDWKNDQLPKKPYTHKSFVSSIRTFHVKANGFTYIKPDEMISLDKIVFDKNFLLLYTPDNVPLIKSPLHPPPPPPPSINNSNGTLLVTPIEDILKGIKNKEEDKKETKQKKSKEKKHRHRKSKHEKKEKVKNSKHKNHSASTAIGGDDDDDDDNMKINKKIKISNAPVINNNVSKNVEPVKKVKSIFDSIFNDIDNNEIEKSDDKENGSSSDDTDTNKTEEKDIIDLLTRNESVVIIDKELPLNFSLRIDKIWKTFYIISQFILTNDCGVKKYISSSFTKLWNKGFSIIFDDINNIKKIDHSSEAFDKITKKLFITLIGFDKGKEATREFMQQRTYAIMELMECIFIYYDINNTTEKVKNSNEIIVDNSFKIHVSDSNLSILILKCLDEHLYNKENDVKRKNLIKICVYDDSNKNNDILTSLLELDIIKNHAPFLILLFMYIFPSPLRNNNNNNNNKEKEIHNNLFMDDIGCTETDILRFLKVLKIVEL